MEPRHAGTMKGVLYSKVKKVLAPNRTSSLVSSFGVPFIRRSAFSRYIQLFFYLCAIYSKYLILKKIFFLYECRKTRNTAEVVAIPDQWDREGHGEHAQCSECDDVQGPLPAAGGPPTPLLPILLQPLPESLSRPRLHTRPQVS